MSAATSKKPIIYVSRDIERTLGTAPNESYLIVANKTPYAEHIQAKYPEFVTLLSGPDERPLGTSQLLEHPMTKAQIQKAGACVMVFKNTVRIEPLIQEAGWDFINPPAAIAEKVENKISQVSWLGDLAQTYLPPHSIRLTKDIVWSDKPKIIQWAHGHTGDSTFLLNSEKNLASIKEKFPERMARITDVVSGPSFTVNAVVTDDAVIMGNISYQITGLPPFTENLFSTIGNDWSLSGSLLSDKEIETIAGMVQVLGRKMQTDGWRGLFGVDLIRDDERNLIYLIEINARQPASTTFESRLQETNRDLGVAGLTIFEAHLAALKREKVTQPLIVINDGAQIVQRLTKKIQNPAPATIDTLRESGYDVITYSNKNWNSDLIRIQSRKGIMETHNKFNDRGKAIASILEQ